MQLSDDTIKILKNFADINESIHFKQGNRLITMHPQRFVLGDAQIKEEFPLDFTIYKLTNLLAMSSVIDTPDFIFKKDRVVVKSGEKLWECPYADPSCVPDPYEKLKTKKLVIDDPLATFELKRDDLKDLKHSASIMGLPHVVFSSDGKGLKIVTQDASNDSLGSFKIEKKDIEVARSFNLVLNFANLKVIDDDYDVTVSPNLAKFVSKNQPLLYWLLFQSQSTVE